MFEHCDFCGGEAIVLPGAGSSFHVCCVAPTGCKMTGPTAATREGASAKWRFIQAAILAALEREVET